MTGMGSSAESARTGGEGGGTVQQSASTFSFTQSRAGKKLDLFALAHNATSAVQEAKKNGGGSRQYLDLLRTRMRGTVAGKELVDSGTALDRLKRSVGLGGGKGGRFGTLGRTVMDALKKKKKQRKFRGTGEEEEAEGDQEETGVGEVEDDSDDEDDTDEVDEMYNRDSEWAVVVGGEEEEEEDVTYEVGTWGTVIVPYLDIAPPRVPGADAAQVRSEEWNRDVGLPSCLFLCLACDLFFSFSFALLILFLISSSFLCYPHVLLHCLCSCVCARVCLRLLS